MLRCMAAVKKPPDGVESALQLYTPKSSLLFCFVFFLFKQQVIL